MKMININGVEFRVGIDKTVIGLKFPFLPEKTLDPLDEQSKKVTIEAKKKFLDEEKHLRKMITGSNHEKHLMKNNTMRYIVKDDGGNYCFEVHLGQIAKTRIINLQFNPSKMTQSAKAKLDELLSLSFSHGYHEYYSRAVISKLELFVDVLDVDISDLILVDLGRRKKGECENTIYHGRRNSRLTMAKYDKAKQLGTDDCIERFECRIKNRKLYFTDYIEQEQKNPFANFVLIAKEDLQLIAHKKGGPKFAADLQKLGLSCAVANKPAKDSIKQELLKKRVDWWDADAFWTTMKGELQLLKPNVFLTSEQKLW